MCLLLHQLAPELVSLPSEDLEPIHLAIHAIDGGKALGAPIFSTPRDLCGTNPRLKMGFVAQIFNARLGLDNEPEITAFSSYINTFLATAPVVNHLLPLDIYSNHLLERITDGLILGELLNMTVLNSLVNTAQLKVVCGRLPQNGDREIKLANVRVVLRSSTAKHYPLIDVNADAIVDRRYCLHSIFEFLVSSKFYFTDLGLDLFWNCYGKLFELICAEK